MFVHEKLPERFLAGEMLELSAARLTLLEEKRRHQLAIRIRDPELPRLRGVCDGLVNGDQIEVRQVSAQFEAMTLRNREVPRLGKAGRQLGAEEMEKRGDTPDQLWEILALEALEAHRLAAA